MRIAMLSRLLLFAAILSASSGLYAQDDNSAASDTKGKEAKPTKEVEVVPDQSMREILESQEETEQLIKERTATDPKSMEAGRTPMETVLGLSSAFEAKDYKRAGEFLDMRYLPEEMDEFEPGDLMRALSYVFRRQNLLNISQLSDDPDGHLDDGLPTYRDLLGTITLSDGVVPVYLQRVPDGQGGKVWKISNATVQEIPRMWQELGWSPVAEWLNSALPDVEFMGMQNWQLFATLVFFFLAWPLSVVATLLMNKLVQTIPNIFPLGIERFFRREMRFFVFIFIARTMVEHMDLSLTARVFLQSSGVDYVAYTVLLLGIIGLIRDYQIRKNQAQGRTSIAAVIRPLASMLKVLVAIIVALIWAESAGYNMSTILAGLGVGSVAVALAAQKTLENLIGAITLYSARPVAPGDFCRFGKVVGTVEEIGLRSTTIRTLNRTQVVIPNSVFSALEVENYSVRDRIRYFRNVGLLADSADQLRVVLARIRELFHAHPRIIEGTTSVRLELVEDATARLRLDAGVDTTDYQDFLGVAEDINLRIIEIVLDSGARFGSASQVALLKRLGQQNAESAAEAEQTLQSWRDEDRLPFPDFQAEQIQQLRGSLDYPPSGSGGK